MENEFLFNNLNNETPSILLPEDKCKIHLAEIYTLGKKNQRLEEKIEELEQTVQDLQINLKELNQDYISQIENLNCELNLIKRLNKDLNEKNEILISSHNHNDILNYYESKFEESKEKYIQNFQMFSQMLVKVSSGSKDDVWKNLIKKYEEKIVEYEKQLSVYSKKERKINSRQKFFEKYCFKAEEKIEEFSKISKRYYEQESTFHKLQIENEKLSKENSNLSEKISNLKIENEKMNKVMNKIQPILKYDWMEIKSKNDTNFESIIKKSKEEEFNFKSENIIILIENLLSYMNLLDNKQKSPLIKIVNDVKQYIIMLLKRVNLLRVNQYNIINTCCDLNENIISLNLKKLKTNNLNANELETIMNEIKNSCAKLLYENNPK